MKKMVCEICGSSNFVRSASGYVCKDCGIEYTLDVAKTLLKDEEETVSKVTKNELEVVKQEKNTSISNEMNNETLLQLKSELLVWYTFHEKCHELENSFKDDYYSDDDTCLVLRSVGFESVMEQRKGEAFGKIQERIASKCHDKMDAEYNEYKEKFERAKSKYIDNYYDIPKKNRFKIITILLAIWCAFVWLMTCTGTREDFINGIGIAVVSTVAFAVFLILRIITVIKHHKKFKKILESLKGIRDLQGIPYNDKEIKYELMSEMGLIKKFKRKYVSPHKDWSKHLQLKTYYEWFDKLYFTKGATDDSYIELRDKYVDQYNVRLENDINTYFDTYLQLKKIYNELIEKIPLPAKYRDEQSVSCLLALVSDGRATTLKEAINLYEEEKFREEVLNKLDNLTNYVNDLAIVMAKGLNEVIKSNMRIYGQLKEINTTTKLGLYNDIIDDILK